MEVMDYLVLVQITYSQDALDWVNILLVTHDEQLARDELMCHARQYAAQKGGRLDLGHLPFEASIADADGTLRSRFELHRCP